MENLTVLTPTYNRADTLKKCYTSLISQTNKNFEWLIVDDGSTDNTEQLIKEFAKNDLISINYIRKPNGGKHTAVNNATKLINSLLTIILDSDDYLAVDAIEQIYTHYEIYKDINNICGFTFLKNYPNGEFMGTAFPHEGVYNFIDYRVNGIVKGEYCDVFFTKYLKQYPFSEFKNEKYIGESTVWIKMAEKYEMVAINKSIYIAEYLETGLTKNGRELRIASPLGGMEYSQICMSKRCSVRRRLKSGILYNCYGIIVGMNIISIVKSNNHQILTLLTYPFGLSLYKIWRIKYKKRG